MKHRRAGYLRYLQRQQHGAGPWRRKLQVERAKGPQQWEKYKGEKRIKGIVLADFGEQNSRKVCMGLKKLGGHEILRKFWYGAGKFLVTKGIEFFGRSFCRKGEWEGENLDPG